MALFVILSLWNNVFVSLRGWPTLLGFESSSMGGGCIRATSTRTLLTLGP